MKAKQLFTEGRGGATLSRGAPTGGPSVPERSSAVFGGLTGPSPFSRSPLGETSLGDLLGGSWGISSAMSPVLQEPSLVPAKATCRSTGSTDSSALRRASGQPAARATSPAK